MDLAFSGAIVWWRGPAPFHFVVVPERESALIGDLAPAVTYGWGMIPVTVTIGRTTVGTSLWPRDGAYVVPIKVALRREEGLELGDVVDVRLRI